MTIGTGPVARPMARPASQGSLAEVVDIILDKGLVLDAYVRVSLVGIELLTVDARVVVASVDTYLHFAEATNRLDLRTKDEEYDTDLRELIEDMREGTSRDVSKGAVEGASDALGDKPGKGPIESGKEKVKEKVTGEDESEQEQEEG